LTGAVLIRQSKDIPKKGKKKLPHNTGFAIGKRGSSYLPSIVTPKLLNKRRPAQRFVF
jgi:hypothetical protein